VIGTVGCRGKNPGILDGSETTKEEERRKKNLQTGGENMTPGTGRVPTRQSKRLGHKGRGTLGPGRKTGKGGNATRKSAYTLASRSVDNGGPSGNEGKCGEK